MSPPRYGFIPISPLASPALLGFLAARSLLARRWVALSSAILVTAGVAAQGLLAPRGWAWSLGPLFLVALPVSLLLAVHMRGRVRNVAVLSMLGFSGFDLYLAVTLQGILLAAAGLIGGGILLVPLSLVIAGTTPANLWGLGLWPQPVWPWFVALTVASAPAAFRTVRQDPVGLLLGTGGGEFAAATTAAASSTTTGGAEERG